MESSCFPFMSPSSCVYKLFLVSKEATMYVCGCLIVSSKGSRKLSGSSRSSRSRWLMDSMRCEGRVSKVAILLLGVNWGMLGVDSSADC